MQEGPVFVYPAGDLRFRATVETSMVHVGGRAIEDEAVLAAVEALLRTSYPLATLQVRPRAASGHGTVCDAFRDGVVLDDELVRRARAGEQAAASQLYDRHARLAYATAVHAAGRSSAALDAVVDAFHGVFLRQEDDLPVRIRLARAARDAALPASGPGASGPAGRGALRPAVVELAFVHHLSAREIAAVLRLTRSDVARLANEGLHHQEALSARRPDTGLPADGAEPGRAGA